MRTLTVAQAAALQRNPVPLAVLVEMDLASGALFLNTGSIDLPAGDGVTIWYGTKGLGKIEAVQDSPSEIRPLKFELSGVPSAAITMALTEKIQGVNCRVKLAIFDPDTYLLLGTPRLRWAGRLDVMAIEDGPATSTLQVTAEHAGIDLLRPSVTLYSDADQRRLYSNDPSLQYMADQVDQRIVWPAATWTP